MASEGACARACARVRARQNSRAGHACKRQWDWCHWSTQGRGPFGPIITGNSDALEIPMPNDRGRYNGAIDCLPSFQDEAVEEVKKRQTDKCNFILKD